MKRFIIQVVAILAFVVAVDAVCGVTLRHIESKAKGGFTFRDNYICNRLVTDILVSGSSRCVRHYNPQIISDSLGMTCYNSGQMGNGIILNYGRLKMIDERKKPKIIIYDLHPDFDMLEGEDNHRYLTWLKSHYDREGISEIFESIDRTEKFKMQSRMYRYNSRWVEIMIDFLHPISEARSDGFSPLMGEMDKTKIHTEDKKSNKKYVFDELKICYINKMIAESGDARLFFVVSPSWYGMDTLQFDPVKMICQEKGITFVDFSNDPKYVHRDDYFKDGMHMNDKGADEFTKDLVEVIRKMI